MKKLILVLGLAAVTAVSGADFRAQSFLNVKSIRLDDAAAGADSGVTNLSIFATINALSGASNQAGLIYTNKAGTGVTVAAGTGETTALLGSAVLWPYTDGRWQDPTWAITSYQTVWGTTNHIKEAVQTADEGFATPAQLLIEYRGFSGVDGAFDLIFYPGYYDPSTGRDVVVTHASEAWTISVTPATLTGTAQCLTNVPTYRWPGMERLYLYSIYNNDSTAGDDVAITRCDLTGWKP